MHEALFSLPEECICDYIALHFSLEIHKNISCMTLCKIDSLPIYSLLQAIRDVWADLSKREKKNEKEMYTLEYTRTHIQGAENQFENSKTIGFFHMYDKYREKP